MGPHLSPAVKVRAALPIGARPVGSCRHEVSPPPGGSCDGTEFQYRYGPRPMTTSRWSGEARDAATAWPLASKKAPAGWGLDCACAESGHTSSIVTKGLGSEPCCGWQPPDGSVASFDVLARHARALCPVENSPSKNAASPTNQLGPGGEEAASSSQDKQAVLGAAAESSRTASAAAPARLKLRRLLPTTAYVSRELRGLGPSLKVPTRNLQHVLARRAAAICAISAATCAAPAVVCHPAPRGQPPEGCTALL
eukprot:scaffold14587_cov55-Phaeocystis_antarctica.AAC.4